MVVKLYVKIILLFKIIVKMIDFKICESKISAKLSYSYVDDVFDTWGFRFFIPDDRLWCLW